LSGSRDPAVSLATNRPAQGLEKGNKKWRRFDREIQMARLKMLFVTVDYPPLIGGMSEHAYGIVKGLRDQGEEVFVLAPRPDGALRGDSIRSEERIYRYPLLNSPILRILVLSYFILMLLLRHRIRVVLNNTWSPCGISTYLVSRLLRIHYFIHAHGLDVLEPRRSAFWRSWMIRVMRHSDRILPVSRFTAEKILRLGIPKEAVTILSNGIDPARWLESKKSSGLLQRDSLQGKRIILSVSRLVKRKGHDLILRAVERLSGEFPDLVYLIVGDGPERERLESLAKGLHLDGRVIFTGYVKSEDLPAIYSACDLFVLTPAEIRDQGDVEGFGIVFLEAGIMGKAVIGSRSGGIEDAVAHEQTGLLIPSGDQDALEQALRTLLHERAYCSQLGQNGKERVLKDYTWSRVAAHLRTIISCHAGQRGK